MGEDSKWRYFRLCCVPRSWFLVLIMCIAAFIQGFVVNGLVNVTVSPIQRRFQLSSADMGLVASIYDIANIIVILPVTFLFARASKSLVTGLTFMILGLGGIIFSLPHFLDDDYTSTLDFDAASENGTCLTSTQQCEIVAGVSQNRFYYGFFLAGQALNGIGAAALWTLGTVYIDENLSQEGAPIAIGIYEGTGVLGPAAGFLVGGSLLSSWVDGKAMQPADMNPDSALWVGNWWLGYVIGGIAGLLSGFLMAGLPGKLKDADAKQEQRIHEIQKGQSSKTHEDSGSARDWWRSGLTLLQNAPFMFLIFTGGFEAGFVSITATYGSKYIEEVYGIDAGTAAISIGAIAVAAGAVGQTVGGIWVGKAKPTVKKQLLFGLTSLLISLCFSFVGFYHCDETIFAGANLKYDTVLSSPSNADLNFTDSDLNLDDFSAANFDHSCFENSACPCSLEIFDPICVNGVSYFSSCFAGCDSSNATEITKCDCLPEPENVEVTIGACPDKKKCHFAVMLTYEFLVLFFTFLNGVPATNSILRMVPQSLKSQAMGLNIAMLRLIGSIPGPIIFGKLIDSVCILWQQSCGKDGSCRLYNKNSFMITWVVVHIVYKILGGIGWAGAYFSFKSEDEVEQPTNDSAKRIRSSQLNNSVGVDNPGFNDKYSARS